MYLYCKRADIKAVIHCSDSEITACRKFIAEHQERYPAEAVSRGLTNILAFTDAYKYRLTEDPSRLPPFDPHAIARLLGLGGDNGQLRHVAIARLSTGEVARTPASV